jgi:hypothetical protein
MNKLNIPGDKVLLKQKANKLSSLQKIIRQREAFSMKSNSALKGLDIDPKVLDLSSATTFTCETAKLKELANETRVELIEEIAKTMKAGISLSTSPATGIHLSATSDVHAAPVPTTPLEAMQSALYKLIAERDSQRKLDQLRKVVIKIELGILEKFLINYLSNHQRLLRILIA